MLVALGTIAPTRRPGIRVSADPVQPREAIDWFGKKTPLDKKAWESLSEDARKRAFTAAWVTDVNVLQSVKDSLKQAIDSGESFESWKTRTRAELGKKWNRDNAYLETVFRNNVQSAYAAGRYQAQTTPLILKLRPFWRLVVLLDGRTSDVCKPLAKPPVVLPADDPWWATHWPPLHHRCRTTAVSMSRRQAERIGILKQAPRVAAQEGWGSAAGLGEWQPTGEGIDPELFKPAEKAAAEALPKVEPVVEAPAKVVPEVKEPTKAKPEAEKPAEQAPAPEKKPAAPKPKASGKPKPQKQPAQPKAPAAVSPRDLVFGPAAGRPVRGFLDMPADVEAEARSEAAEVRSALSNIPESIQAYAVQRGATVYVVRRIPDRDKFRHLAGTRPRGWPEWQTWDDVRGAGGADATVGLLGTIGGTSFANVALHEWAHALDRLGTEKQGRATSKVYFSRQAWWRKRWEQAVAKRPDGSDAVTRWVHARTGKTYINADYYKQPWPAGAEEMWADIIADAYESPRKRAIVENIFPGLLDEIAEHVAETMESDR